MSLNKQFPSQVAAMPHVSSQMQTADRPRDSNSCQTPTRRSSHESRRPANASPDTRTSATRTLPNLALLAPPNSGRREYGPSSHQRQDLADPFTPLSATDSVFEASSADPFGSPNSSTRSFIAELEDTSRSGQQALCISSTVPTQTTSSLVGGSPLT